LVVNLIYLPWKCLQLCLYFLSPPPYWECECYKFGVRDFPD
jgi:hypothetical protein